MPARPLSSTLRVALLCVLGVATTSAVLLLATSIVADLFYYRVQIVVPKAGYSTIMVYRDCAAIEPELTSSFEPQTRDLGWLTGGELVTITATSSVRRKSFEPRREITIHGEYFAEAEVNGRAVELVAAGNGSGDATFATTKSVSITGSGRRLYGVGVGDLDCENAPLHSSLKVRPFLGFAVSWKEPILDSLVLLGVLFLLVQGRGELVRRPFPQLVVSTFFLACAVIGLHAVVGWQPIQNAASCFGAGALGYILYKLAYPLLPAQIHDTDAQFAEPGTSTSPQAAPAEDLSAHQSTTTPRVRHKLSVEPRPPQPSNDEKNGEPKA